MEFKGVQELNQYLVENTTNLTIYDYIHKLHDNFYENVDLSFMNYFLEYIDKDGEFIIDAQESLYKFGAIIAKKKDSNAILNTLNRSGLVENIDYQFRQLSENLNGGRPINKYMLNPDAYSGIH